MTSAPAGYDPSEYPPFAVTADIVALTIRHEAVHVLLVRRADDPYRDRWALPGGFVNADEDLEDAARRELAEETGISGPAVHLEQLSTYGHPDRDPRMRVVSVAHLALLPDAAAPRPGSDAADSRWWPLDEVTGGLLAFDHDRILRDGVERARAKLEYTAVATAFLGPEFTLRDLQTVYETVWGVRLHRPNFRRKVLATDGFVIPVPGPGEQRAGRAGRRYRSGGAPLLHPAVLRPRRG